MMRGKDSWDQDRRAAVLTGVLFIAGTVSGIASRSFTDPTLQAPDYLARVAAHDTAMTVGALLAVVMGVALVGMALAVYPVLKRCGERLALGYLGVRLVEFVGYAISAISLLCLLVVSRESLGAAASGPSSAARLTGTVLLAVRDRGVDSVLDVAVFPLGALMLNGAFLRARLVPRWLSAWGLAGAVLYWSTGLLVMFGAVVPMEAAYVALQAPLGVQEMLLAGWLIVKGFDRAGLASIKVTTCSEDTVSTTPPPRLAAPSR
jgi:hypothetical protein